ncbi:MAG TPA: hypothetical protein VFU05_05135 [Cyclobacteriaceae bacterium]|nr:hypothetical protein [Cyclobacteriaceae bacterium]
MKLIVKLMVIVLISTLTYCGEKEKSLYDQVMDIHDEVMPKMDDIYKFRKSLNDSLSNTPDMPEETKKQITQTMLQLDSAGNSMMIWMREFNPPDQKDEEAFKKYMESELVKVKKMREDVMRALKSVQN